MSKLKVERSRKQAAQAASLERVQQGKATAVDVLAAQAAKLVSQHRRIRRLEVVVLLLTIALIAHLTLAR